MAIVLDVLVAGVVAGGVAGGVVMAGRPRGRRLASGSPGPGVSGSAAAGGERGSTRVDTRVVDPTDIESRTVDEGVASPMRPGSDARGVHRSNGRPSDGGSTREFARNDGDRQRAAAGATTAPGTAHAGTAGHDVAPVAGAAPTQAAAGAAPAQAAAGVAPPQTVASGPAAPLDTGSRGSSAVATTHGESGTASASPAASHGGRTHPRIARGRARGDRRGAARAPCRDRPHRGAAAHEGGVAHGQARGRRS
jgi:hypothetical protein